MAALIEGTPTQIASGGSYTAETTGTNRAVVFVVQTFNSGNDYTVSSLSFGAQAATKIVESNPIGLKGTSSVWYILEANIPTGSQVVTPTLSGGSISDCSIHCYTLSSVNQTTPSSGSDSGTSTGFLATVSFTSLATSANGLGIGGACFLGFNNRTWSPPSSWTEDTDGGLTSISACSDHIATTGSILSGTFNLDIARNGTRLCAVASFAEAAASGITISLPVATETDSAQSLGKTKIKFVPVAIETDLAQILGRSKLYSVGIASEVDLAQALSRTKVYTLQTATETDVAVIITLLSTDIIIALPTATEVDSALDLGRVKIKQVQPASEVDLAQNFSISKVYQLTPAISGNIAQGFSVSKVLSILPATETDSALDFGKSKIYQLPTALELDQAIAITLAGAGLTLTPEDIQAIVNALIADGRVMTLQKWLVWKEIL